MKTFYIFLLTFCLFSCSKDGSNTNLEVELKESEMWRYDILSTPTDGGIEVINNSDNYQISEIIRDTITPGSYYLFQPKEGFFGTETVILRRHYSIGGTSTSFSDTTIKFNVTE